MQRSRGPSLGRSGPAKSGSTNRPFGPKSSGRVHSEALSPTVLSKDNKPDEFQLECGL